MLIRILRWLGEKFQTGCKKKMKVIIMERILKVIAKILGKTHTENVGYT